MTVTYKFRIDANYYRDLIGRYYQQRPFIFRLQVQFGCIALVLMVFMALAFGTPTVSTVAGAAVIAALVYFGGISVIRWGIFQRFRYRADFGSEVTINMSDTGLNAVGLHAKGEWAWAAYPSAARFSDGVMLLRPGVIRWLPDSALIAGTRDEATALVSVNSKIRAIA
jgi:hypothetical protein